MEFCWKIKKEYSLLLYCKQLANKVFKMYIYKYIFISIYIFSVLNIEYVMHILHCNFY